MVERRRAGEPVAYITGQRAFWTIDLEVGPGALDPAPRQRDLDRRRGRAFRRHARARRGSSTSAPGRAPCCSPRSTNGRSATGLGIDASPVGSVLCPAQCRPARPGRPRRVPARRLGRRGSTSASTSSCATRPMSRPTPKPGPGSPNMNRPKRCSPGADGLDDYRRLAPQIGCLLAPRRTRRDRDRPRPGRQRRRLVRRRRCTVPTARARPCQPPARLAASAADSSRVRRKGLEYRRLPYTSGAGTGLHLQTIDALPATDPRRNRRAHALIGQRTAREGRLAQHLARAGHRDGTIASAEGRF